MLPKPDELNLVQAELKKATREYENKLAAWEAAAAAAEAEGSAFSDPKPLPPRLGVVEAAFDVLRRVKMLHSKMRACEFK